MCRVDAVEIEVTRYSIRRIGHAVTGPGCCGRVVIWHEKADETGRSSSRRSASWLWGIHHHMPHLMERGPVEECVCCAQPCRFSPAPEGEALASVAPAGPAVASTRAWQRGFLRCGRRLEFCQTSPSPFKKCVKRHSTGLVIGAENGLLQRYSGCRFARFPDRVEVRLQKLKSAAIADLPAGSSMSMAHLPPMRMSGTELHLR